MECLQYDGKTTWEASLDNQMDQRHFVTVVEQPGDRYVDFYKTENEQGLYLSEGMVKIINKFKSQDTLLAIGKRNF